MRQSVNSAASASDTTVKALAGVAMPLNDDDWLGSLLNFASLNAEAAGMMTATAKAFSPVMPPAVSRLNNMAPGAIPKVTTSARLSSSLPRAEYAFSSLAANPSEKSSTIPAMMQYDA